MNDDLISRQAAIDAIEELKKSPWYNDPQNIYRTEAVDIVERLCIKELPSAQPERKKGKWINRSLNILYPEWERYTCSVCGKHSYIYDFCPNCGADMQDDASAKKQKKLFLSNLYGKQARGDDNV